jgi:hypothetical protein
MSHIYRNLVFKKLSCYTYGWTGGLFLFSFNLEFISFLNIKKILYQDNLKLYSLYSSTERKEAFIHLLLLLFIRQKN